MRGAAAPAGSRRGGRGVLEPGRGRERLLDARRAAPLRGAAAPGLRRRPPPILPRPLAATRRILPAVASELVFLKGFKMHCSETSPNVFKQESESDCRSSRKQRKLNANGVRYRCTAEVHCFSDYNSKKGAI